MCKNNPCIKSLKLNHCCQITSEGVRNALHMLNKLEILDIEGIKDSGSSFFVDENQTLLDLNSSIKFKFMKK